MDRLTKYEDFFIGGTKTLCNTSDDFECNLEDDEICTVCEHFNKMINKLAEYEDLEEQGRLIKLPITIENVINNYILGFQLISLWKGIEKGGVITRKRIWFGLPRNIPKELKSCKFKKILGNYMENIENKDVVNIEVTMSEGSEKALAEMGE